MTTGIFQTIDTEVTHFLTMLYGVGNVEMQNRLADLLNILTVSIALYILYKGYMVLSGQTQEPIKDLLWDIVSKVLIIGILRSWPYWAPIVKNFVDGLAGWAVGLTAPSSSFLSSTDTTLVSVAVSLDLMVDQAYYFDVALFQVADGVVYPFYMIILWIGIAMATGFTFLIYIVSKITLTLLIVLAPIAVYCKVFGFLKGVFSQYIQLILSSLITLLVISIAYHWGNSVIIKAMTPYIDYMIATTSGSSSTGIRIVENFVNWLTKDTTELPNPSQSVFFVFMACMLQVVIVKLSTTIAQGLAQVSAEAAGVSAVTGVAGTAVGAGVGVGIGAGKLGKAAGVGGMAGGIARGAAGGVGLLGKLADNKLFKGKGQSLAKAAGTKLSESKKRIMDWINKPRGSDKKE